MGVWDGEQSKTPTIQMETEPYYSIWIVTSPWDQRVLRELTEVTANLLSTCTEPNLEALQGNNCP